MLEDNTVAVAPVAPATAVAGAISFPFAGGAVEAETPAGTIDHSGGLEFSAGTSLEATDFIIDTTAGTLTTTLTAEAAAALNDTFSVTIFEEGLSIGDVVVRATA